MVVILVKVEDDEVEDFMDDCQECAIPAYIVKNPDMLGFTFDIVTIQ